MKKLNVMQAAAICGLPTIFGLCVAYVYAADYFASYWSWL